MESEDFCFPKQVTRIQSEVRNCQGNLQSQAGAQVSWHVSHSSLLFHQVSSKMTMCPNLLKVTPHEAQDSVWRVRGRTGHP